jgi:signal transduction histidine kinase
VRPRTVRGRIAVLAALSVSAILIVLAVVLVTVQRRSLVDQFDQSLSDRATEIGTRLSVGLPSVLTGLGDDDTLAQVIGPDGRVVSSSASAVGRPPLALAKRTVVRHDTVRLEDHTYLRVVRRVDAAEGPSVVVILGDLDDIEETIRLLRRSLVASVPVVGLLLAVLVWWLAGRALRPVDVMRTEMQRMSGGNLHERIPEPGGDDEIARLARTMNDTLARIEASAERQQRFVADASHELRSPIARMRAEIEVDLAHPLASDFRATHRSVLHEAIGMQRLVEDLLLLAGNDADRNPCMGTVDLDELVEAEADRLRRNGTRTVHTVGVFPVQVPGDSARLTRAVRNLADNAARHATGNVWFTMSKTASHAELRVADDGHGVPKDQREQIFERFARLDEARSTSTGGSGLGLAISQSIVASHGGSLAVTDDRSGGACFIMRLPIASGSTSR